MITHAEIERLTPVANHVGAPFGAYVGSDAARRLNLAGIELGFVNCDLLARQDVAGDERITPLPFSDASFECVLGAHVFQRVRDFLPLVADLHRILQPGGYLIAVTPHCGSDDAWDSPHHVRAFSENTWRHVAQQLFERQGLVWRPARIDLVPYPDLQLGGLGPNATRSVAELEIKRRFMRNVIHEVHVVLQKVEKGGT